jgi:neutral trehalase
MDLSNARDVSGLRKDNKKIDASMRPTDLDYKRYVHLIDLLNEKSFNEAAVVKSYPFLVQENMFISFLIRSNEALIKIGNLYKMDTSELEQWQALSMSNERIQKDIIGGMMALFAGIPSQEQASKLAAKLTNSFVKNESWFYCPSYSAASTDFDAKRYWRGPLWPNVNWLLYHGFKRYGFNQLADTIKSQTIYLIEKYGMFEYFDPTPETPKTKIENTKGLGGANFSWTAAIYLDFKFNHNLL